MKNIIFYLLIALTYCKSNEQCMRDYVKCVKKQIGKKYSNDEEHFFKGPDIFNNPGLIFYCRLVAGFPLTRIIYLSYKNVKKPKIGAYVKGVLTDNGRMITGDNLGVIVALNPTTVVGGDPEKGVLTRHVLNPKKNYIRLEYIYLDD